MAAIQRLPYLGTAEEDVLFVSWQAAPGEAVRRGRTLAVVETLKAAFEVEAEHDGVLLRQLVAAGTRVPVQAAIAVLGSAGEACDDAALQRLGACAAPPPGAAVGAKPAAPGPAPAAGPAAPTPVAPAARRRAQELGIDPATVRGTGDGGLVRVADVEAAHAARPAPADAMPAAPTDGTLEPAFVRLLADDQEAFAALASDSKVALYRRHGARIGDGCRFGQGALLRCDRLVLGRDASFGDGTRIEARSFTAGALAHFGRRCRVRCTTLVLGDNAFFTDDIEIGGGGAMEPEAELRVGSHGFVGEHVHLNPCRPLCIGDEVVLSRNAVVMTHSFGASILKGYPNRFAGVRIGDGAQIGIGAVLFPGVEVGAGAIVLSGSSLVSSVPPGRLFGGVPAKDLKAAATPLSPSALQQLAGELLAEFARQLQLRGHAVQVATGDGLTVTLRRDGREHVLRLWPSAPLPALGPVAEDVQVSLQWPAATFAALPPTATGIDLLGARVHGPLGPLGSACREFLRKRGVRLEPRCWAYTGGLL